MIHLGLIFYSFLCSIASVISDQLFATLWTVAHQAPLSMGFSRQKYWSGLPCHPSRDLPYPGIEPASPALQAASSLLSHYGNPSVTIRMRLIWVFCLLVCFIFSCCCLVFCLRISNYSSTIWWKDTELFLYLCKKNLHDCICRRQYLCPLFCSMCFTGAAVRRYPTPKVRETSARW